MPLPPTLKWWLFSDAGLAARVVIGVAIFAILASIDLHRHGRSARRWREYLFLLAATAAGVAYGAVNDLITSSISWEYFYYGKGLNESLGPHTPPDMRRLHLGAMQIGMKAAGAAALVIGACLLVANNPRPRSPQLSYRKLFPHLARIFAITAATAILLSIVGALGGLTWLSADLQWVATQKDLRPTHFFSAFGAHLGSYAGGAIALLTSILKIARDRKRATPNRWNQLRRDFTLAALRLLSLYAPPKFGQTYGLTHPENRRRDISTSVNYLAVGQIPRERSKGCRLDQRNQCIRRG